MADDTRASMDPKVKRAGDMLVRRIKAKDALLVAYRIGRPPSEKVWDALSATEGAEAAWTALTTPSGASDE